MPRRSSGDDDDESGAIWDALGRGTAAGRAVFNLYSGDSSGRAYGKFANDFNVEKMATADPKTLRSRPDEEEARKRDEAVMSSRRVRERAVRRPGNFRGRAAPTDDEAEANAFARMREAKFSVRPKAVIDRDVAARFSEPDAPAPARRLIGEAGKLRFQRQREFNGVLPEENPALRAPPRRPPRRDDPAEEARAMERAFDDVAEELEAFEERLRTCRGGAREVAALRAEVGDRVATLRRNWTKASRARGPRRTGRSDADAPAKSRKDECLVVFFLPPPGTTLYISHDALERSPLADSLEEAHVPASDQRRGRIVREVRRERQAQLLVVRQVPHTGSILLAVVPEGGLEGAQGGVRREEPQGGGARFRRRGRARGRLGVANVEARGSVRAMPGRLQRRVVPSAPSRDGPRLEGDVLQP